MAEAAVVQGTTGHERSETGYELQSWPNYSWNLASKFGQGVLKGEKLAYGFGVTTPDWQYVIDIHDDMEREEREEREAEEKALKKQREQVLKTLKAMEENSCGRTHTP